MINTLIFDIGGVITFTDFDQLYVNFAKAADIDPGFVTKYHKEHFDEMLVGNVDLPQFLKDMQAVSNNKDLNVQEIWVSEALKIKNVNTALLDMIADLRKKYSVGTLTNLTPGRKILDEAMGLYEYFDFRVLSCDERLKKPDHRFFEIAIQRTGIRPNDAVLVDDKLENIQAAQAFGMGGIQYSTNDAFVKDLESVLS